MNRRSRRRGYTVVEVMMALVVLTLGTVGVIAMQRAVAMGNTNARNLATANAIAESWVERLRTDAQSWNDQGSTPDIAGDTGWLKDAVTASPTNGSGWIATPPVVAYGANTPAGTYEADIMGADLMLAADKAKFATAYCTQYRLTRFSNSPTTGALADYYRIVRIEVRVIWDRLTQQIDCTALPSGWDSQIGRYGTVYVVASALQNKAPF
jgi:type IV pilus assembly protein PilV